MLRLTQHVSLWHVISIQLNLILYFCWYSDIVIFITILSLMYVMYVCFLFFVFLLKSLHMFSFKKQH